MGMDGRAREGWGLERIPGWGGLAWDRLEWDAG